MNSVISNPYNYYKLGVELFESGSYAGADQALSAAIQQQQFVAEAYYFLAESLRKQKLYVNARHAAEAALLAGTVFNAEALMLLMDIEQEQQRAVRKTTGKIVLGLF
jgi:TolA-binding protein